MFLLCNITVQGISLFMPTLLAGMGYSKIQSQLLTVPPYILSSIWSIFIAYACQKTEKRGLWTLVTTPLSILGSALLIGSKNRKVEYAGIFFLAMGSTFPLLSLCLRHGTQWIHVVFPLGPIFLAWGSNNSAPYTTRAVSSAMIVAIGSLGPIISAWIYLPNDRCVSSARISAKVLPMCHSTRSPRYIKALSVQLGGQVAIVLVTVSSLAPLSHKEKLNCYRNT